eukprot:g4052.t1
MLRVVCEALLPTLALGLTLLLLTPQLEMVRARHLAWNRVPGSRSQSLGSKAVVEELFGLRAWVLFLASISFRNALGVRQRTPKAKIACVGDSLTAGYPFDSGRGPDASVSGYPYHLQELLADEGYEVRNFGKGETTVVSGSKSYRSGWYNETWQEALRWKPDRVLLMFGANDVKESRLKKFENEFEDAFTQLIQSFLDLDPPPVLALLIPPPMYDNNIYGPEFDPPGRAGGMQQKVYNQQLPLKLQELAERMQALQEFMSLILRSLCAPRILRADLAQVSDFAMHAGLGLLIGVPLAAMLVPPAIEAGDVMASQILAWRSETDMETSEAFQLLFDNIFPMEFGAKQDWQSEAKFKMRKRMRDFLRLRWLSLTVLLLLLGLLIIYCVASLQGSSVYTAETPRLFQVGHRLYDKARVSGLFDPLEDYQAPMRDALQEARRCSPTASTSAQCTWFKCDAGPSAELQDRCQCYTVKGSGACTSAAARLFGAKAGGIAQGLFWSWAGARLGTVYSNASTWAEGLLEIEVWSSGGRSLNPAVQSTVEAASWETACLQILCFCGGMDESWSSLGTLEYGTTFDSAWSLNEANDSVNAETSVVTNDPDLVNLSFAWGIQVSSEPLSGETGLSFSRTLVLEETGPKLATVETDGREDLDSQRQLLAFCEGTAPDLEIVQRSCWPIDFKTGMPRNRPRWLQERGSYYPVAANDRPGDAERET